MSKTMDERIASLTAELDGLKGVVDAAPTPELREMAITRIQAMARKMLVGIDAIMAKIDSGEIQILPDEGKAQA